MRITTIFSATSKSADSIRRELDYYAAGRTIYDAYAAPSSNKVRSYNDIVRKYLEHDDGTFYTYNKVLGHFHYNGDLRVTGASSHFYSTVATFTRLEDNRIFIVKETYANTYLVPLTRG